MAISGRIGECLTREMGKPFRESNWEGGASAGAFRYYAELARHDQGRIDAGGTCPLKNPLQLTKDLICSPPPRPAIWSGFITDSVSSSLAMQAAVAAGLCALNLNPSCQQDCAIAPVEKL